MMILAHGLGHKLSRHQDILTFDPKSRLAPLPDCQRVKQHAPLHLATLPEQGTFVLHSNHQSPSQGATRLSFNNQLRPQIQFQHTSTASHQHLLNQGSGIRAPHPNAWTDVQSLQGRLPNPQARGSTPHMPD